MRVWELRVRAGAQSGPGSHGCARGQHHGPLQCPPPARAATSRGPCSNHATRFKTALKAFLFKQPRRKCDLLICMIQGTVSNPMIIAFHKFFILLVYLHSKEYAKIITLLS